MNSKDILASAGTLMVIAGVVTAALAGTNALTEGVIARRAEETENAARRQVIDADSFEKATLMDEGEEVVYYIAQKEGAAVGYVFTTVTTGKSSGLTVMTGLDAQGTVTGVQVTADNETAGYVDKVTDGGLLDAFQGQNAPEGFVLGETVDGVSQATKTSRGVVSGVNLAMRYYETYLKGGEPG